MIPVRKDGTKINALSQVDMGMGRVGLQSKGAWRLGSKNGMRSGISIVKERSSYRHFTRDMFTRDSHVHGQPSHKWAIENAKKNSNNSNDSNNSNNSDDKKKKKEIVVWNHIWHRDECMSPATDKKGNLKKNGNFRVVVPPTYFLCLLYLNGWAKPNVVKFFTKLKYPTDLGFYVNFIKENRHGMNPAYVLALATTIRLTLTVGLELFKCMNKHLIGKNELKNPSDTNFKFQVNLKHPFDAFVRASGGLQFVDRNKITNVDRKEYETFGPYKLSFWC